MLVPLTQRLAHWRGRGNSDREHRNLRLVEEQGKRDEIAVPNPTRQGTVVLYGRIG